MKVSDNEPEWSYFARFWSKVNTCGDSRCWEWTGAHNSDGYGRYRNKAAHRVAWEIANGEDLGERWACHHCDNPSCCNPAHIYAGNPKTNAEDMSRRGRKAEIPQDGENNGNAKLTTEQAHEIARRIAEGESNTSIAKDFPVSHSMVSRIRRGKAWHNFGHSISGVQSGNADRL